MSLSTQMQQVRRARLQQQAKQPAQTSLPESLTTTLSLEMKTVVTSQTDSAAEMSSSPDTGDAAMAVGSLWAVCGRCMAGEFVFGRGEWRATNG